MGELEKGWSLLQEGMKKVTNLLEGISEQRFNSREYSILYSTTWTLCNEKPPHGHHNSRQLYYRYEEFLNHYNGRLVLPALRNTRDKCLLTEFVKRCDNQKTLLKWGSLLFSPLERYFIKRLSLRTLNEASMMSFQNQVYAEIKANVSEAVITLIDQNREGEIVEDALLKNVFGTFGEMACGGMNISDFELATLTHTAEYYFRKSASWIQENSFPEYMLKVEECIESERERVLHYPHPQKLLEKVHQGLLLQHTHQLLEHAWEGCQALLRHNKIEDLSRVYRLFCKIPNGVETIATIFEKKLVDEGTALFKQAEDGATAQKDLVRKLIDLHELYLKYLSECFVNQSLFEGLTNSKNSVALKEGCEVVCNKTVAGSTSSELLAIFYDNLLNTDVKGNLREVALEETLEKAAKLFAYISDIDLFAEFHRKKLARRLIRQVSNEDCERMILSKLKQQRGSQFTSKMEGMVNDLALAREHQNVFEGYINSKPASNPGVHLAVTAPKAASWPSYKSSNLTLPAEMVKGVEVYRSFYQTETNNRKVARKLDFNYSLATCWITAIFCSKPVELKVTLYQAAVLLLFNEDETLSYADIKGKLNLADEDIVRLLHSLSCSKHRILSKEPSTPAIMPSDHFELNTEFSSKTRHIKISLPPLDEKKKAFEEIDKDRRHSIDAAVIRILKSRKVIKHQELVLECVDKLFGHGFKPDAKLITQRIEDLIHRQFLERDTNDTNTLRYLA